MTKANDPPPDLCDLANQREPIMTDPNTEALSALAFCASHLIEIRDEDGADQHLAIPVTEALKWVRLAMMVACGSGPPDEPNRG